MKWKARFLIKVMVRMQNYWEFFSGRCHSNALGLCHSIESAWILYFRLCKSDIWTEYRNITIYILPCVMSTMLSNTRGTDDIMLRRMYFMQFWALYWDRSGVIGQQYGMNVLPQDTIRSHSCSDLVMNLSCA